MPGLQHGRKFVGIDRERARAQVVNQQVRSRLAPPQCWRVKLPLRPGVKVLDDVNCLQGFRPQAARISQRPFVKQALCRIEPPALAKHQQFPVLLQVSQHGRNGAQGHARRGRNGAVRRISQQRVTKQRKRDLQSRHGVGLARVGQHIVGLQFSPRHKYQQARAFQINVAGCVSKLLLLLAQLFCHRWRQVFGHQQNGLPGGGCGVL